MGATRHGLLELSRRDSAPRVSLTNLELLRFPPRKRKVNFGKPEEWILRKTNPETEVKNIFTFRFPGRKQKKKKPNANLFSLKLQENSYWFCLSSSCLYNKQLLPLNNSIHNFDSFFHYTQQFSVIFSKCSSICQTLL